MSVFIRKMVNDNNQTQTVDQIKTILKNHGENMKKNNYMLDPEEHESISERINDFVDNAGLDDAQRAALMDIIDDYSEDHDKGEGADPDDKATTPAEPKAETAGESYKHRPTVHQYAAPVRTVDRPTWLDSAESLHAFGRFMLKSGTPGKNAAEFNQYAASRMGVDLHSYMGGKYASSLDGATVENILVPQPVADRIMDAIADNTSGLYNMFTHTGFLHGKQVAANTLGLDTDQGRAHGYGVTSYGTTKTQMMTNLVNRFIRPMAVYAYMTLDHGSMFATQDTDAALDYILRVLPPRLISTIEKQAMFGAYTDMPNIRGVLTDATDTSTSGWSGTAFAHSITSATTTGFTFDNIAAANATVLAPGQRVLVTSRANLETMRQSLNSENQILGAQFANPATMAGALGVDKVITPYWWNDSDNTQMLGVVLVPSAYETVGQNGVEAYTNFSLKDNTNEYLQEMYVGGALGVTDSACVILPAKTGTK